MIDEGRKYNYKTLGKSMCTGLTYLSMTLVLLYYVQLHITYIKLYPRSLNITVHITTKIPELPLLIKIEKVTNDNVYLLYYRFKIILIETETAEKRGH